MARKSRQRARTRPNAPAPIAPPPAWRRGVGLALLFVAVGACVALLVGHFSRRLPGCGFDSGCGALERSAWGRVPLVGWPLSFVGLAYFGALANAWATSRGELPRLLRAVVRVGAALSVLYLVVMAVLGRWCPYCLAVHVANLAFVALVETAPRGETSVPAHGLRSVAVFALTFAGFLVGSLTFQQGVESDEAARAETGRADLVARAVENVGRPSEGPDRWGSAGFTGRYRRGPEAAPIRIVLFTDYQCPDCRGMENQVEGIAAARPDVSVSVKHFPMDARCNTSVVKTLHPNACWAARAAEAAGILGGEEAFWAMHRWLFSVGGRFETDAALAAGVQAAGLDLAAFKPVMMGPETLRLVQADAEEGVALGLYFTPMVFVNGIEVKWSLSPGDSVTKAVDALAAQALPARTAAEDRPPLAAQKYVEDWLIQPRQVISAPATPWPRGRADAAVEVVVFGDYMTPGVREVERDIALAMTSRPFVRHQFRHYPVNAECNPALPPNVAAAAINPLSCEASRLVVAAGLAGGDEAFWKAHDWLVQGLPDVNVSDLRAAASALGLDGGALERAAAQPEVDAAIVADSRAAQALGVRSLPLVFVDGRHVPRASREGDNVLARILDEARERR